MKGFIKLTVISFLLSVLVCLPLFSAEAKVTYVKGKVEISRNGGEWNPLKIGDVISQSDTINTGFQSEARVNINGSIMAVPALTRVTLETLSVTDSKDTVNLYVNTGAVRSKVTHTDNKKIEYTARTSVAVASVRGTDFFITSKGKVVCKEGAVAVYSAKKYKAQAATSETTEETESEEEAGESDNGSANATTEPKDITESSPDGAVVVGAGQTTTFKTDGNPEKSKNEAAEKSEKIKNQVNTQSEKDAVNGNTKTDVIDQPKPKTGSIVVEIVLED